MLLSARVPWSEEETALLIDVYLRVKSGELERHTAINNLSNTLRNIAIRNGNQIDDVYRNQNGIGLRFLEIQRLFDKTLGGIAHTSSLFVRMVEMYKNDRSSFNNILKQSLKNIADKDEATKQNAYDFSAIDTNGFEEYLNRYYQDYNVKCMLTDLSTISDFCHRTNICKNNLLEKIEIDTANRINDVVEHSKLFNILNKKNYNSLLASWRIFYNYINSFNRKLDSKVNTSFVTNVESNAISTSKTFELINNSTEKRLSERYPLIYKRLFDFLNEQCNSNKWFTINEIREAIKIARPADLEEILDNVTWCENNGQNQYRFWANKLEITTTNIVSVLQSTPEVETEKAVSTIQIAYETSADDIYKDILIDSFKQGFKLDSSISLKRFRKIYEELTKGDLIEDDNVLRARIRKIGLEYDGKVFVVDNMIPQSLRKELFDYIDKSFQNGNNTIYFEALFREFEEKFLDYIMYDKEMLKAYLILSNNGRYKIDKDYIYKQKNSIEKPYDIIKDYLIAAAMPVSTEVVCRDLQNLPQDLIRKILANNSEFIRNAKSEYFHPDVLDISNNELEIIANYIENSINVQNYISGNELYNFIRTKLPILFSDNSVMTVLGWREFFKYKLNSRFDFSGNVISRLGETISVSDIFSNYAKNKSEFTLDDILLLSEELDTNLTPYYFEAIYKYALRISQSKFVNKNKIYFDVPATDIAISRFCNDKYIPIKDVNELGTFPDAAYPWSMYMLEQYVAQYSDKYSLIHSGYNRNSVAGAIVKKESHIADIDNLVIDILANNDLLLKKDVVLDYLVKNGYLVTRSYANIEDLMIKAKSLRNMKGNNK